MISDSEYLSATEDEHDLSYELLKIRRERDELKSQLKENEVAREAAEKELKKTKKRLETREADMEKICPSGWTYHPGYYLDHQPIDPITKKIISKGFTTLAEAFAEAERLGDACGGITIQTEKCGTRKIKLRATKNLNDKTPSQYGQTRKERKENLDHISFRKTL